MPNCPYCGVSVPKVNFPEKVGVDSERVQKHGVDICNYCKREELHWWKNWKDGIDVADNRNNNRQYLHNGQQQIDDEWKGIYRGFGWEWDGGYRGDYEDEYDKSGMSDWPITEVLSSAVQRGENEGR